MKKDSLKDLIVGVLGVGIMVGGGFLLPSESKVIFSLGAFIMILGATFLFYVFTDIKARKAKKKKEEEEERMKELDALEVAELEKKQAEQASKNKKGKNAVKVEEVYAEEIQYIDDGDEILDDDED